MARPRLAARDDGRVGMRCPILVGREAELSALRAHLANALGGRGGFVLIRGEPGLGKSRLCRELIDGVRGQGTLVTVGRAVPSGASAPYRPLAEAVLRAVRARGVPADEAAYAGSRQPDGGYVQRNVFRYVIGTG